MLDCGCEHMALVRLQRQRAVDCRVVALGAAARKHNLFRLRIDQRSHFFPSRFDVLCEPMPELICARRIAPKLRQIRRHRLEHFRGDASSSVVIEIDQTYKYKNALTACAMANALK